MYVVRKNFVFHNKMVVAHIESQPNQSSYIESLVFNNMLSQEITDVFELIRKHKTEFVNLTNDNICKTNFSNSISNILNL